MLNKLKKRAKKHKVSEQIEAILCTQENLGIDTHKDTVDLVVAIHVLHEMSHLLETLKQVRTACKAGAKLLVIEPAGHVSKEEFGEILGQAAASGFQLTKGPKSEKELSAVFEAI
jgi:ubiquinone/menaquinone biosynthesis C-methylase UbiE